jgi:hypothetical protein
MTEQLNAAFTAFDISVVTGETRITFNLKTKECARVMGNIPIGSDVILGVTTDDPKPQADDVETIRKTFEAIIYSMGQAQIFGNDIKREILNTERWAKEALTRLSAPIDVQAKAEAASVAFCAYCNHELIRLIVEQFSRKG